jgi:pimeloyl-ACP methyl ester carboxylesterase
MEPSVQRESFRREIAHLASTVIALKPLLSVLGRPARLPAIFDDRTAAAREAFISAEDSLVIERLINQIAVRVGTPELVFSTDVSIDCLTSFELVVQRNLDVGSCAIRLAGLTRDDLSEVNAIVDEILRQSFEGRAAGCEVLSFDNVPIRTYATGTERDLAVVIASVPGMPAQLCERWMQTLERKHFVLTWETRSLFGDLKRTAGCRYDVAAQSLDLIAVMDHFKIRTAHVMGLCGGAVIALMAASQHPARISSLSIWHGDLELGRDCPKTPHQQDLQGLMAMAAKGPAQAADIHRIFCQPSSLSFLRPDIAHLVLYPYGNNELLRRYSLVNGAIMSHNADSLLPSVSQPTLVVTSNDDDTAHPAGSKWIARRLPNAILQVEAHGDHLSLFEGSPRLTALAENFIQQNG